MRRIWVSPESVSDIEFQLTDEAFRHAIQVVKFRLNEEFEVVCGDGSAKRVRLTEISKRSAKVQVLEERKLPKIKKPYIRLALALPKWAAFEFVVEKSVELGVQSVQPLFTEFSFVRAKSDVSPSKWERIQKVITSATEQSSRGELLEIHDPLSLTDFIKGVNRSAPPEGLFAYEGESPLHIQSALSTLKNKIEDEIWLLVGSEGGFSKNEVEFLQTHNWPAVTMGSQILRVDTACLSALSVIKYELGLMV